MALNWKVAAAGGAVLGLGIGGFSLASADSEDPTPVRDVDLQSARDSIHSASSPVRIPSTTTTLGAGSPVAPPPATDAASGPRSAASAASASSPVAAPAPAPAPAPVYEDSASPVQPAPAADPESAQSAASVDGPDDS